MRRFIAVSVATCLLLTACAASAGPQAETPVPVMVLNSLAAGRWNDVYADSTDALREAVGSPEGLAALWKQLTDAFGAYSGAVLANNEVSRADGVCTFAVNCSFANAEVTLSMGFTPENLLASIAVTGVTVPETAGVDEGGYAEEAILLRAGAADETNGLLTLPEAGGPFPAVILVHGSGAADMNETALANAPFRDLARGLARLGVASIRYDKYTYAHAENVGADFTVDDEYANDAAEAAKLLAADARIGDIYLLGHSQGAMLAPRIMCSVQAEIGERLAGGVLLEGTPLHLWEVQYRQNLAVLETLTGAEKTRAAARIDAELARVSGISELPTAELQKQTIFGISAYYQADEMSVDAIQTSVRLSLPLFIAQGGKDWQVPPEDGIDLWRARLPENFDATYALYANMNHLLCDMETEPTGTPADYTDAGARVSEALIEDIAAWIFR